MRIAALSDIHSNHVALKACFDWILKNDIDRVVFLGDYLTDCPYPQKTLDLMKTISKKYPSWFVRGNREDYLLKHHKNPNDDWCYNSNTGSLLYTYENLNPEDFDFLERLPLCQEIKIDGLPAFTICHGSPNNNRQLFYPNTPLCDNILNNIKTNTLVCGHCHRDYIYKKNGRTVINGGSIGCSVNRQTNAQFSILESYSDNWIGKLVSVEYDIEKAILDFYQSGLIEKCNVWARGTIKTLRTGTNYIEKCMNIVKRTSAEKGLPFNTETLWEQAAKKLGI